MVGWCADFGGFFSGTILPLVAYATLATSIIIAFGFMLGRLLSNPKVSLWAKTEVLQLFISVFSVFFLLATLNAFCAIKMNEVASIFDLPEASDLDVYDAAQEYLREAALYSHNALTVVRYHLEAYTILSYLNAFICDFSTGSIGWGCLFGYGGESQQPLGGYGGTMAALNIFFNATLMAHFTALNFLFILLIVYKGFAFIFLPLGIFLRSMPYMRSFGSLMIALALSFLIVYPFMLGVLYLMGGALVDRGTGYAPTGISMGSYSENVFPANSEGAGGGWSAFASTIAGESYVRENYFSGGNENVPGAIGFAAYAFIAAIFLPSAALLATIASVAYLARLYGEEIDLSRITQLV